MKLRLAFAAAFFACAQVSAHAEVPASGIAQSDAAFADLDALARRRQAAATLPSLSNPEDAPALERFWDADAILGAPPYTAKDVPALLGIFEKQQQVFKSYAMFAAQPGVAAKPFEDESARSAAFLLRAYASMMPAMADYLASGPGPASESQRQSVRQARAGLISLVAGVAIAMRDGNVPAADEDILAGALAQSATEIARGLKSADRERLAATLKTARPHVTQEAMARIDQFVAAMARRDCEGLCAVD